LHDLKRYADENGFHSDGISLNSPSEQGPQWSPTRWKELSGLFIETWVKEEIVEKVPARQPPKWLQGTVRIARHILAMSSVLAILLVVVVVGLFVNFVNSGGRADSVGAPMVIGALTLRSQFEPAEQIASRPTSTPGQAFVQFSGVDGARLIFIPAGEFTMGSNYEEREQPVHRVNLSAYWMDQYEVTNKLYAKCVNAGVCSLPSVKDHYDDPAYANHPVVFVDWKAAQTYCEWAGRRLPTEAEWEKAARGTDERTYPWGVGLGCPRANYDADYCKMDGTTLVGSYPKGASPYGLLDMAGNVWEWVSDWYSDSYTSFFDASFNPMGPQSGEHRVLRGGSWISDRNYLRTTDRWRNLPEFKSDFIGFRCAMSASR
jgi:serine/threonine-protein kinase